MTDGLSATNKCGALAAAKAKHRLVRVTGDHSLFGARGQHSDQSGRLRVKLLGIVYQQDTDARALGGQQLGIDRESLQSRTDQLGGT